MEEILKQAQKVAEAAEVFSVSSEDTPVQFEANRLKHIQSNQNRYLTLRIIKNGCLGYAVTTDPDKREELVAAAVETSQFGRKAEFSMPAPQTYPEVNVFDSAMEKVTLDQLVALGEAMVSAVRKENPDVHCDAEVVKGSGTTRIINSSGGEVSYRQSGFALGISGQLIRDTDMLFVGDGEGSCHPINDTKKVTALVLRQLELAREQAAIATKLLPVIFTPNGVASALISPLMSAFNGKVVLEGASPLAGKIGNEMFDRTFSLYDDPTIAYQPHSRPTDDEGTPSQRTALVEGGKVSGFIYDLQTAALAKTKSTANGGRSRGGLPNPTPSAFTITPGSTSFEDMLSDIKEGLIIEYLMGADQGNILSGDFSGNVLLGYKIESGKIVGRVKDTMVSGNVYQLLKEITAVGSDAKWEGDSINTPSFYCPGVSVAVKN